MESFRHVPFRSVRRVPSSTLAHVSASPPTIPDGRLPRVRFWPRLCTPFIRDSPSCVRRSLSCSLTSTPPRHSYVAPSSQLLRGCLPALCLRSLRGHQDHRVPRAPLPGMGVTHRQGDSEVTSEGVTPPSQLLRAHASDHHPLPASWSSVGESVQVVASPCWSAALPDIISAICVWVLGPIPRRVRQMHLPIASPTTAASRHEKHVRHTGEPLRGDFHRERYCGAAVIR